MSKHSSGSVRLSDGFFKQNLVLMSGLFAGPVIGGATSFEGSLVLCLVFTVVSFVSVGLCRLLSKKIAFAIRVVIYALIASLVYIPVMLLAGFLFGESLPESMALYLLIVITNPLILSKTESRFFLRPVHMMFKDLLGFVLGFDFSCILVGAIRDILADNIIGNLIIPIPFQIPSMDRVYSGFILVGVLAGLFRFIYNKQRKRKRPKRSSVQASANRK